MDVDAVSGVVVGGDGNRILGISGICDDGVGIGTEKVGLIGDKAPDRQPEMECFPDVQRVPYQDPPDPGHGVLEAHKDKLAPGAHIGDLGVDRDPGLFQEKGHRVLAPERNGDPPRNFAGRRDKAHRVDTHVRRPQLHRKTGLPFPHTQFSGDLIRVGIHDSLEVMSCPGLVPGGGDDGGTV